MFQIEIHSLKPGVHEMTREPDPSDLGLDPDQFRSVRVEARLDVQHSRILAQFSAAATAVLECDRTLVMYETPVEGRHAVLFAPPEVASADDDDVYELGPTDRTIDLTEPVRDTLLLALPTRRVAPGAEDAEIPTRFGEPEGGDAVDPRWEALRALRTDESDR